jgi:hypothetical protein
MSRGRKAGSKVQSYTFTIEFRADANHLAKLNDGDDE